MHSNISSTELIKTAKPIFDRVQSTRAGQMMKIAKETLKIRSIAIGDDYGDGRNINLDILPSGPLQQIDVHQPNISAWNLYNSLHLNFPFTPPELPLQSS